MVTRKVSIWIRYKQEGEWVMKRAQWSANRRNIVPGMAKGARIAAEEYLYYLRYQRDGRRAMEPAGRDSVTAVALATTREIELFAAERGQKAPNANVVTANSRDKFADAAQAHLRQIAGGTKRSTYNAYRLALENFQEACPQCLYLDQVNASLRAFIAWMRERLDQTTVYNRFSQLLTFLAKNGIEVTLPKGERPKRRVLSKDGTDIETYSDEDIKKLLAACRDERERLIVLVASESGMRRGEVAHLERENVYDGKIVVRAEKRQFDFTTKKKRGRTVGVPRWLTDKLRAYAEMIPVNQSLLFPSRDGRPSGKALNGLTNRIAKDGGVKVPRTISGERQPFHGFRSYAAIKRLREGRTIYEVMEWLGWEDADTMMRYLKKAKGISEESRLALDATKEPEYDREKVTDGKAA
jgi:integrase